MKDYPCVTDYHVTRHPQYPSVYSHQATIRLDEARSFDISCVSPDEEKDIQKMLSLSMYAGQRPAPDTSKIEDRVTDLIPPTLTIEHLTAMAAAEKPTMPDKPQNTLTPDNIVEHIRMAGEVLNEQRVPDKRVFCPWCGTEAKNLRRVDSGEAYECACTDAKNAERENFNCGDNRNREVSDV